MAIDNDNSDNYEARRNEQRRLLEKQQAKAQQEQNPMKSFEAKLSKQASQEAAAKHSMVKSEQDLKRETEQKGEFLKKILGSDASDSKADLHAKARHHEEAFAQQKTLEKKDKDHTLENKLDEKEKREQKTEGDKKSSDVSAEGHKKVGQIEKDGDNEKGSGMGGQNSSSGGEESSGGESKSHDQSGSQKQFQNPVFVQGTLQKDFQDSAGDGSDSERREMQELDEIVASVQHAFLENGEEVFAVQMTNEFFEGLRIEAKRQASGVVLTFLCPNVLVRSQMTKLKSKVLKRFEEKNIQVLEVKIK